MSTEPASNVAEIMTKSVVSVHLDDSMQRIREIFEESRFHHLIVTDERGKAVGIISDRDLLQHLSPFIGNEYMERPQDRGTLSRKAHQIMSRQLVTCEPTTSLEDATQLLLQKKVSCLPVVNAQRRIVGIVTWRDLLQRCYMCGFPRKHEAA